MIATDTSTLANLSRFYSFMAHPDTLLPMPTIDDPLERFVSVIRFYLSGWHIKPPYVFPFFALPSLELGYSANARSATYNTGG